MSLLTTIQTDRQAALGKDRVKYSLYGVIIAEVQRKTTANDVDDSIVLQSIKKLLESVNESLKYSITDVLESEKTLLENLLPKQLSNDELLSIMKDIISKDPNMKEKKNMFPYLKANFDGMYNGKDASTLFGQLGV
ncbi:hypothetical protein [Yersinia phage fHe-Yen9-04]|uniref:Uncharacterized protein n=2 Tax=Eneladusvirus Yen904 TaxID=2560849 RepID=A0A2C9CXC0_9CAUD|nr:tRNA amidotransferase [Yersinia phage fHe-Yen9-04]SOK58463.1 hypothetical protein [Yersinia phage fHe-Yen9-04]SOK58998.1 hypothetical protein [Yersinia phage fHe-Yen9-03]VUE36232.1 hypothetical protein [Yersinia phage fHe-Yen9-04]